MFVREKVVRHPYGTYRYLLICKSVRKGNQIYQETLLNLGRVDKINKEEIERLVKQLSQFCETLSVVNYQQDIFAHNSKDFGAVYLFKHLWEKTGLGKILLDILKEEGKDEKYLDVIFAMVLNRIIKPSSELSSIKRINSFYQMEGIKLHQLYKALDILAMQQKKIEDELFWRVKDLFNLSVEIWFYDTTSVYMNGENPKDLLEFGYSKDKRPDKKQFLIGVVLTREGFPIASYLFPGNKAETKTIQEVLDDLSKRFNVERVIFVCDRGMVNDNVLSCLKERGIEYIVGVKMRLLKEVREEVLTRSGRYCEVNDKLRVKEVYVGEKKYIVCFNEEEAEKDKRTREEILDKLRDRGFCTNLVKNKGIKKFLRINSGIEVDWEKVREDEKYDGKYVLLTNTELSSSETALAYKELWKIERFFRTIKNDFEVSPVYHFVGRRVYGHVFVCFLAYVMLEALKREAKRVGVDMNELLKEVERWKVVELEVKGKRFLIRTELSQKLQDSLRKLGMKVPSRILEVL